MAARQTVKQAVMPAANLRDGAAKKATATKADPEVAAKAEPAPRRAASASVDQQATLMLDRIHSRSEALTDRIAALLSRMG